jgi:hypothetical protein
MTMIEAALVKEQGITFVVVSVRDGVIDNPSERDQMVAAVSLRFRCPAVLMGATHHKCWGRRDLSQFVANVGPARLPWRKWDVAA